MRSGGTHLLARHGRKRPVAFDLPAVVDKHHMLRRLKERALENLVKTLHRPWHESGKLRQADGGKGAKMSTGERGDPIVPVMHCWEEELPDGTPVWFFQCPHCNRNHMHGAGPGHRFARCGPDSPFFKHGYILAIKTSASAEDARSRMYGYAFGLRETSSRPPNLSVSPKPSLGGKAFRASAP
jgi:hypothetical protein